MIETVLRLSGTYWRGRSNAAKVMLRNNEVFSERLPSQFDGFTILHISDLHADMSADALIEAARLVSGLQYDLCVLTGDYRGRTYGEFHSTLREMLRLREVLTGAIYGVLGNHDTIMMVPDLERMSIQMLLNEHVVIERDGRQIFLAGIDDAHFYTSTTLKKSPPPCPRIPSQSCYRTPRKPTERRRMPGSICCWRDTRTAGRSACPEGRRSSSNLFCRGRWAAGHGTHRGKLDIRLSGLDHVAFPFASIARPKSRSIVSGG